MPITTDTVVPDPVPGSAAMRDLKEAVPSFVAVSAKMTEITASGVSLAKFVLWIVVGSIGLLFFYLAAMDVVVAYDIEQVYQKVYTVGAVGAELEITEAIGRFRLSLISIETDPAIHLSPDDLENAESIYSAVALLPSVSETQKILLKACIPPPADRDEKITIDKCVGLLDRLKEGLVAQASSVAHSQAAAEAATKIGEQRQALHTFWVQIAQLVLLNLLLPLLTALLGYVFGTQQAQK